MLFEYSVSFKYVHPIRCSFENKSRFVSDGEIIENLQARGKQTNFTNPSSETTQFCFPKR